jgi:glycerol kinase
MLNEIFSYDDEKKNFLSNNDVSLLYSDRVNGGVSNNDFICQSLADICDRTVSRPNNAEMSVMGVALLAGQVIGIQHYQLSSSEKCKKLLFLI